jgi:hypothetical protein
VTPHPAPAPRRRPWLTAALLAAAVLVPAGVAAALAYLPADRSLPVFASPVAVFPPSDLRLDPVALGAVGYRPQIANVRIFDLDRDGRPDVIACDARRCRVLLYRSRPGGGWDETPLGPELNVPCGATPVDLDGDGDLDLVVPVLGSLNPTDDRVGQVVWLENKGDLRFERHVLLDDLRRVTDVQPADFNGDGRVDLAVAVYGFEHGEVLWLENRGNGKFRDHLLMTSQGPSHVPVVDLNGDGKPDIAALVSQDHEEVWAFEGRGDGTFTRRRVTGFLNFDLGSAGLTAVDLNRDGRTDLVLTAGDNLEISHHYPQPWHGVYWLENKGDWRFERHFLGAVGGAYATAAADMDGDGDTDLVVASLFNEWRVPGAAALVLLENDGRQNFTRKTLADRPVFLVTAAAGDLDGDGRPDVVAGTLNLDTRDPRAGRLTVWYNRGAGR